MRDLSNALLDAIDPDKIQTITEQRFRYDLSEDKITTIQNELIEAACRPFDDPKLRQLIKDIKQKSDIVIDDITTDQIIGAGYDLRAAEAKVKSFKEFIEQNKNELIALQILYNQPYGKQKLTYAAIKELTQKLTDPPHYLDVATVWQAYRRLDAAKVRGAPVDQQLTEIVSLVRYALGMDEVLEPFGAKVEQRFNLWMGRQKKAGRNYTEEQMNWLKSIAQFIAANAEVTPDDFMTAPAFADKGGLLKARQLFGAELNTLMDDLQMTLVA